MTLILDREFILSHDHICAAPIVSAIHHCSEVRGDEKPKTELLHLEWIA